MGIRLSIQTGVAESNKLITVVKSIVFKGPIRSQTKTFSVGLGSCTPLACNKLPCHMQKDYQKSIFIFIASNVWINKKLQ